jgi:hypothetical protein
MTDIRNMGPQVQAEILKTVRRSQDAVVDAIRTWADTVRTITPPMPELSLPLRDKLPKPEELVGNAYDFAEKLLASQRKFAEDVLRATASVLPGSSETGDKKDAETK